MKLGFFGLFVVVTVLGSFASLAAADDTEIERARDLMENGQALYLQGRYVEAAEEFQRAYEVQPFGAFLYNVAVAYEHHGAPDRAADFFARYLEREPNAADQAEVRARIETLRTQALRDREGQVVDPDAGVADPDAGVATDPDAGVAVDVDAALPTVTENPTPPAEGLPRDMKSLLSVRTDPVGAQVTVRQGDRTIVSGSSPFAYTFEEGEYRLVVEHPDFEAIEERMNVRPGEVYNVIVALSQGHFLGYLRVVTDTPGASVFIDDRDEGAVGQTPFQNVIATGRHRIWVERPGYRTDEREIEISVGEQAMLRVDLTRVDFGRLRVIANPRGSRVFVDERMVGTVPFDGDVSPGRRRVRVEADGMKDWEEFVDVRQGQVTPLHIRLRPAVSRTGAWVTSILGALSLGAGITLGILANGIEGDLVDARDEGRLATNDPRFFEGQIFSIAADVAFGLGTVLGVLGLYYFLRDPLPESEGTVYEPRDWALAPYVDPNGAGGAFVGRF